MAMLYLDNGIPVNSATFANEETWFELIWAELLVEHSHTAAGGFAEAAGTELCKGNVECRAGLYRHVSASNVKLFSSFTGSLMH